MAKGTGERMYGEGAIKECGEGVVMKRWLKRYSV